MTLPRERDQHTVSTQAKIEKVLRLTTCSCRIGAPVKNKSWNIVLKLARVPRANWTFLGRSRSSYFIHEFARHRASIGVLGEFLYGVRTEALIFVKQSGFVEHYEKPTVESVEKAEDFLCSDRHRRCVVFSVVEIRFCFLKGVTVRGNGACTSLALYTVKKRCYFTPLFITCREILLFQAQVVTDNQSTLDLLCLEEIGKRHINRFLSTKVA